jgi:uncharacterized protein DUF6114/zinc ribbon protein
MGSPTYGPMFPSTAHWLSLVGGALIALSGIAGVLEGIFDPAALESIVPGISTVVIAEGIVGIILGVVIIFLAFRMKSTPESARFMGILVIISSILSLFGGDGFFVGLILALLGGILAVSWRPPVTPQPIYGQAGYGLPLNRPVATGPWGPPAAPPTGPGAPWRFCSYCGSPNVATAQFCSKCGATMS